jgi:hypothetical protein
MLNVNGERIWEVACESCGDVIHVRGNKKLAVAALRRSCWTVGRRCLCPKCRNAPREQRKRNFERYKTEGV